MLTAAINKQPKTRQPVKGHLRQKQITIPVQNGGYLNSDGATISRILGDRFAEELTFQQKLAKLDGKI
jgi:hypothetical protein